jgi:hypothetical protein
MVIARAGLDVQRDTSPPSIRSCHLLASVMKWESQGVTVAGYFYAMRPGMKFQIITLHHVSHLELYGVTVLGNITGVYPPLNV